MGVSSRVSLTPQGPEFSRIIFGMWRLSEWSLSVHERQQLIEAALELGVTSFDHADIYGNYQSEALFGEVLAVAPHLREHLQLVSKCGIKLVSSRRPDHRLKTYDTGFEHIVASAENSLRALHTEYLDALLIHRPDPLMDADEVARAFKALHQEGKVRHFGVSNFTPSQFALLQDRMVANGLSLVTNQVECSLLQLSPLYDGTFDQAQQLKCAPMLWSPLGGGRIFTGSDPVARRVQETLGHIGEQLGASATTVLMAWLLALPSQPLLISGSRRIDVLCESVQACQLALSKDHWFELLYSAQGHEIP